MLCWRSFVACGLLAFCTLSLISCESIDQKVEKSTVLITYGNQAGHGSGFFIQGPKEICAALTAAHVVASDDLKIRTYDHKTWSAANFQTIPSLDLGVVTFKPEGKECPYQPLNFSDSDKVKRLDKIYVAGFPSTTGNLVFQFIPGEITAISPPKADGYAIAYSAETIGGSSGGPVVNQAGEVIAVHGLSDVELRQLTAIREGSVSGQEAKTPDMQFANIGLKWGVPIKRFPKDFKISTTPDVLSQARKWLSFGERSYERWDYQGALEAYEEALKVKNDYAEAWYGKGRTQYKLKKFEEAVKSFDKAIQLKRDYAYAWLERGVALYKLERYKDAFDSFEKATQLKPDYALAWYNRGQVLRLNLQQYKDAIDSYDNALKYKYSEPADAWYSRALALFELQEYQKAVESFDEVIQLKSYYADAWFEKGRALARLSEYEKAIAAYEKLIEIDPKYKVAWDNKCWALNNLERYREALDACDKSNAIEDNDSYTWNQRGLALEKLERYNQALESYEKALKIRPYYQPALDGRERVNNKLGR